MKCQDRRPLRGALATRTRRCLTKKSGPRQTGKVRGGIGEGLLLFHFDIKGACLDKTPQAVARLRPIGGTGAMALLPDHFFGCALQSNGRLTDKRDVRKVVGHLYLDDVSLRGARFARGTGSPDVVAPVYGDSRVR